MCVLMSSDKCVACFVCFALDFNILFTLKMWLCTIAQYKYYNTVFATLQKYFVQWWRNFLQVCEQDVRTTNKSYFAIFTKACGQVFRTKNCSAANSNQPHNVRLVRKKHTLKNVRMMCPYKHKSFLRVFY